MSRPKSLNIPVGHHPPMQPQGVPDIRPHGTHDIRPLAGGGNKCPCADAAQEPPPMLTGKRPHHVRGTLKAPGEARVRVKVPPSREYGTCLRTNQKAQGKGLMSTAAGVEFHPFSVTLQEWETGVPVDCGGRLCVGDSGDSDG